METSVQPASLPVASPTPLQDQEPSPFSNPSDEPPVAGTISQAGNAALSPLAATSFPVSDFGTADGDASESPDPPAELLEEANFGRLRSTAVPEHSAKSSRTQSSQAPTLLNEYEVCISPDEYSLSTTTGVIPKAGNTTLSSLATTSLPVSDFGAGDASESSDPPAELVQEANSSRLRSTAVLEHSAKFNRAPNEYEVCISPDEHSNIEDPLLKCTPFIANRKYMTLICTDCGCASKPRMATTHYFASQDYRLFGSDEVR